jgi:hypothetical protein
LGIPLPYIFLDLSVVIVEVNSMYGWLN